MNPPDTLAPMLAKLRLWRDIEGDDAAAVLALPHRVITYRPQEYIVREGDQAASSCLMLSGFAIRHKVAGNGGRQIFSIHMQGDLPDIQNSFLGIADHNLQTLCHADVALIPVQSILDICFERPVVGHAIWRETLVDASIFREWILNVGRRDAHSRTAHLLCEFAYRLEAAGLGERYDYELPMTQEQLADALGLTSVHVNRTLQRLEAEGVIVRTRRAVQVVNWDKLAKIGDFDSAYLHADAKSVA